MWFDEFCKLVERLFVAATGVADRGLIGFAMAVESHLPDARTVTLVQRGRNNPKRPIGPGARVQKHYYLETFDLLP
ncbi:MAG: hypothetical protein F6J93_37020 [Oscillatoria sp. SIO1A7]|nr:hypothetical protein [Oscillatoria sp. SIO1A7]